MKFLKALVMIIATVSLTNCSKDKVADTSLSIIIKESITDRVAGATVKLYASEAAMNTQSSVLATGVTDANGVAKFTGLSDNSFYYWSAQLGCKNNTLLQKATAGLLTKNKNNIIESYIQPVGWLTFTSNSTNPYQIFVNDVSVISSQAGGSTKSISFPGGAVTVRVLQLSGYVITPTEKTYTGTLSCGSFLTTTFPN